MAGAWLTFSAASGYAQWIDYPTPGTLRTPDGKPNLSAPAPRTAEGQPDLSGIWMTPSGRWLNNLAADGVMVPFRPWAEALFKERQAVTVILFEAYNHYRQVMTDGRPLPKDPQPSWLGYSVGRWDGDAFVVDTIGFNDQTWLDDGGHPHSEELRVTERFHRRDFGHMDIQITIDDAKAYTRPWTVTIPKNLLPDTELIEWMCENENDYAHMVGK
jgi:hypothetical protein